jgi:hypothetical protein
MTDRELIDLAAKAADLGFVPSDGGVGLIGGVLHAPWNPLHDDADAFRLAVKLGIDLVNYPFYEKEKHSVVAERTYEMFKGSKIEFLQDYGDDPLAATRRAITRAAAEIGKAM